MSNVIYLGSRTPLPEAVAARLPAEGRKTIEDLARVYQVEPRVFYGALSNSHSDINPEVALSNMRQFFLLERVRQGFTEARDTVFSRPDKKKSSQARYTEALEIWTEHIVDYFQNKRSFLELEGFSAMWKKLMKFDELEPTRHSQEIRDGFRRIVQEHRDEFSRLRMLPLVYGSTRFGDAGRNSDIDVVFCYNTALGTNDSTHRELKELIGTIDRAVEADFGQNHQLRDIDRLKGVMVDMDEVYGIAQDILDGATTDLHDYTFKGDNLYAFHTLLEGQSPISGLGEVEEQLAEVAELLHQGAKEDPYFNLLLSYKLLFSLEKREANRSRRK